MKAKILIIDDEPSICYSLTKIFHEIGYNVQAIHSGKKALEILEKDRFDLILLDNHLEDTLGIELLPTIRAIDETLMVILMTAYPTAETAIEATKQGAIEYILKPFDIHELKLLVEKALHIRQMNRDKVQILDTASLDPKQDAIIGQSKGMQQIYKTIGQVAPKDITVLIQGETGTGKELVARAIHQHSPRKSHIFLPINCAAIPEELLESELFGHEKGAFTSAHTRRIGKFEQCHKGTIFLDEIGDMSMAIQAKILRFLQDKTFQRLGGNETIHSDVRIIAATNVKLEDAIKQGRFREDLYYRLSVIKIDIPPLRERLEDLNHLINYFLLKFSQETKQKSPNLSSQSLEILKSHTWPGNIRELENALKRGILTCKHATILPDDLNLHKNIKETLSTNIPLEQSNVVQIAEALFKVFQSEKNSKSREKILDTIEQELISMALKFHQGNQVQASTLLGMNRSTFRKKLAKYGIQQEVNIFTNNNNV